MFPRPNQSTTPAPTAVDTAKLTDQAQLGSARLKLSMLQLELSWNESKIKAADSAITQAQFQIKLHRDTQERKGVNLSTSIKIQQETIEVASKERAQAIANNKKINEEIQQIKKEIAGLEGKLKNR